MKIISRMRTFLPTDAGVLVVLALIALVTFGIFIPFTGFYWDDWLWKFFSFAYSSDYLLWQPVDRPLVGTIQTVLEAILGNNPVNWQITILFFRWLNVVSFYWMLKRVFSLPKTILAVVAAFFLVYPGFSEQWISIAFVHHLIPMTALWFSFSLMFDALENENRNKRFFKFTASFVLSILVMFNTEYFYGIELFRGVLLFYYLSKKYQDQKLIAHIKQTARLWWPFVLLSLVMFYRRSTLGITEGATYSVALPGLFTDGISTGLLDFIQRIGIGIYTATVGVLIKTVSFPNPQEFGNLKTIAFYSLILVSFVASGYYFYKNLLGESNFHRRQYFEIAILGLLGLTFGGLPFWAGGLQYSVNFPFDRLGLSMMMGASLFLVGIVLLVTQNYTVRAVVLAGLFALGIGSNFVSGTAFVQSWEDQQDFWGQFVTRVPSLKPGTVLVTNQLPPKYMNDLSFMFTLNWLYDLKTSEDELKYALFYPTSRGAFQTVEDDMPIVYDRRLVKFYSDINHTLAFYYSKYDCLIFFDGEDGLLIPTSRNMNAEIIKFSDIDQIDFASEDFENWPDFFDTIPENNWCYYYEKASLELQRENYSEVARLGDIVFSPSFGDSPKRAWERVPFIEGYAFVERWNAAMELTIETIGISPGSEDLLCSVWGRINVNAPESETKQVSLDKVRKIINCER